MIRGNARLRRPVWLCVAALSALASFGAAREVSLIEAVRALDTEAVRVLLKRPIDVNAPAADGTTPLHWAVHGDNLEIVDQLIRAGASVNATNRYGVRPVSLAAINGNALVLKRLLTAGADPNATRPDAETALMIAARTGTVDAIRTLLAHGANVNAHVRGQTALMWAAARNNSAAIRVLADAGADVRSRTARHESKTAKRNPNPFYPAFEPQSWSALMFAARVGALDAVRTLLDLGADVNDTVSDGQSALVIAVANAHGDVADLLLDNGGDPNLDGAGWNALHQAVKNRRMSYGNAGAPPEPIRTGSIDNLDVIRKMIARGVDVNARMWKNGIKDGQRNRFNRLGATAFILAAKNVDTEIMRILLEAGADPRIPNAEGTTPLMVAAGVDVFNPGQDGGSLPSQYGEVLEAVKMCVELGIDINAANLYGLTALHGAAMRGIIEVVQYLADQGADLDAKEANGFTPLAFANGFHYTEAYKEQPHIAKLLRTLMQAGGLSTEGHVVPGDYSVDYLSTIPSHIEQELARDATMEAEYAAGKYPYVKRTK